MSDDVLPPVRTTEIWRGPDGSWAYDFWGFHGRPVILIHTALFDRTIWWPPAADLRTDATVVAVDLPGHGLSPGRQCYRPDPIVEELALLIHDLEVPKAPVIVGHGSSACIADLFAARYASHAVITVDAADPEDTTAATPDIDQYLADMRVDAVPPAYHHLITPVADAALLAAYINWRCPDRPPTPGLGMVASRPRLSIRSRPPEAGELVGSLASDAPLRQEFYGLPGRFAHLTNVRRFVYDVRSLL